MESCYVNLNIDNNFCFFLSQLYLLGGCIWWFCCCCCSASSSLQNKYANTLKIQKEKNKKVKLTTQKNIIIKTNNNKNKIKIRNIGGTLDDGGGGE